MLLVAGASGFLGRRVALEASATGRAVTLAGHRNAHGMQGVEIVQLDLTQGSAASSLLRRVRPQWVVNCAGYTDVDGCERDNARAMSMNATLPRLLAMACAETGARLVHVSTDSVFDGLRGNYTEEDPPSPINAYARSKFAGEEAVREVLPDAVILRTNFIGLSESGKDGLADWITHRFESGESIQGFADVIFAPLFSDELARLIFASIDSRLKGLYHASASDACSKYEFVRRLGQALGFDTSGVGRASLAAARLTARRPLNTSLLPGRLERALGRKMPTVQSAIETYAAMHTARCARQS